MSGYVRSDVPVTTQRCAFGADAVGYCSQRATEHIWVGGDEHTMACPDHSGWFDTHPHRDRHPVGGACALPGSTWIYSHATGGPGWCEVDEPDWLSVVSGLGGLGAERHGRDAGEERRSGSVFVCDATHPNGIH